MQIRLSVLAARDGAPSARAQARGRVPAQIADVLVTAPAGTTLGAVAGALAGAVGARPGPRGSRSAGQVLLFAGDQRLDERSVLGHPPLLDGVVLRLDEPDPDHVAGAESPDSPAELRVVGGPDAGGIHLLLPGRVRVGRSAEADVPLDDPDVSRFHLALDVSADGRVTLADLGSTNGTALDGAPVGAEPLPLPPGAVVTLGESALRVALGERRAASSRRTDPSPSGLLPDGQGHLQLAARPDSGPPPAPGKPGGPTASGTGSSPIGKPPGGRAKSLLARGGERLLRGRSGSAGRAAEPAPAPPRPAGQGAGASGSAAGGSAVGGTGSGSGGATPPHGVRLPPARLAAAADAARWPDPAELLHTALGPGPRLWERGPEHPDALALRLGSLGPGAAPAVLDLRAAGSLGLTGPRARLTGLARALLAQLAVLHGPGTLELVLVAADPSRPAEARTEDWSWLHWLPQLRPGRGQPCRLLTAFDPEQALARLTELEATTAARPGGFTVLVVDGDPGGPEAAAVLATLLAHGPARGGVHLLLLAERPDLLPPGCGATAAVTGEVGTLLSLERPLPHLSASAPGGLGGLHRAAPARELVDGIALDAVSAAWAERLARALAPLREPDCTRRPGRGALPDTPRLLDLLGLDQVTPARLSGRWAELQVGTGTLPVAVVGSDREGPCGLELTDHLLIGGAAGSGRTELLRALLASLAVAERPDRLGFLLIEGRPSADPAAGLRPCAELPHVTDYVDGSDELRLLYAAQTLLGELDRREQLLQGRSFASWHAERALARLAPPRRPDDDYPSGYPAPGAPGGVPGGHLILDTAPPAHLVVVVDDHDELLLPGRERAALAAALDAVAVRGPRLGIQLAVSTGRPDRSSGTDLDEAAHLRIALRTDDARLSSLLIHVDDAATVPEDRPGRGWIRHIDGGVTALQTARISGRIPRTATLRPTVAPLDWTAMGDPPPRRPVRELGNGPTDLALLASALQRASETLGATPVAPLL
ncbi:FHA domain-containing protein [Streptacidiphilus sp. N1-12]|uniref:FHA domain-containing protein n=2 Tax=Streptacidiphilus alkalitolerans TaxID=3342712 RepID=A0ABV6WNK7_9ACTN